MGFYSLMQTLGIGKGDEVILQGHTCSVMPNAVWRTGATPVFADIDPDLLRWKTLLGLNQKQAAKEMKTAHA